MLSLGILLFSLFLCCNCAPVQQLIPVGMVKHNQRDPITDWIQSSEWFPIEINVPDTISGIGQGLSNFGSGFVNWVQGIPFINRITSQFQPRPFKYMLVAVPQRPLIGVPVAAGHVGHHFNPFDGDDSNFLSSYP